ncbi:MAG: hydroxymethylbilane synthase [Rickettsiales bacterium]|nr:hydroxymethylbilane synthase [Rickettsiales bacterium]
MTSLPHRLPLRLGTRASALAMAQATETARHLCQQLDLEPDAISIHPMTTSGDKHLEGSLTEIGGKGLFTKELEEALMHQQIDFAVHSLKDMATALPAGLIIAAVLPREDVRDALLSNHEGGIEGLPHGAQVGTASLRRAAQMLHQRPDLRITPLRGNVATRIAKLRRGEVDATLLAVAGLKRLGLWEESGAQLLEINQFLPAVAQGAIALQCHQDNIALREILSSINHRDSFDAITAERAMLRVLDGSCRTPIGGYAMCIGDQFHLRGQWLSDDGQQSFTAQQTADRLSLDALGESVGRAILAQIPV